MKAKGRSWRGVLSALAVFAMLSAEAAVEDFDLPAWESESDPASFSPGKGLWPDETPIRKAPDSVQEKSESEKRLAEFVLLRPDKTEPAGPPIHSEILDDLPELNEELLKEYFGQKPVDFLVDPQGLITEQKANDVLRFLEYHSEVSRFGIYPIVLGHQQTIPGNIDFKKLHEEWFGSELGSHPFSILLVYHLLDPESLQIFYNQSITDKVPASDLAGIRRNIIDEALLADNSADQLEKIAIEMSIRAFLLEKLLDGKPIHLPGIESTPVAVVPPSEPVQEVVPSPTPSAEPEAEAQAMVLNDEPSSPVFGPGLVKWILGGSVAILFLGFALLLKGLMASRRTLRNQPILFPSYIKQERLGGEFTGGAFVGISFELGRSHCRMD